MIKILIITDDFDKWSNYIKKQVNIDKERRSITESSLINDLFYFSLRHNICESYRGTAWSHVILDKEINYELERNVLIPTIKHCITRNTNLLNL
jgi:hypothetical protein